MNGYLTRAEATKLASILKTIPWLTHRLTETILRQDRITGAPIPTLGTGDTLEQPLPYNHAAVDVRDTLHNTLTTWARHVLDQRGLDYDGDTTTAGIARWLHTNLGALALTEGSAEALPDIEHATQAAWRVIDRPEERIRPVDQQLLDEADRMVLSKHGIADLAKELGEQYKTLTARRVQHLRDVGAIQPVSTAGRALLYLVGDVRRAHLEHLEREQLAHA